MMTSSYFFDAMPKIDTLIHSYKFSQSIKMQNEISFHLSTLKNSFPECIDVPLVDGYIFKQLPFSDVELEKIWDIFCQAQIKRTLIGSYCNKKNILELSIELTKRTRSAKLKERIIDSLISISNVYGIDQVCYIALKICNKLQSLEVLPDILPTIARIPYELREDIYSTAEILLTDLRDDEGVDRIFSNIALIQDPLDRFHVILQTLPFLEKNVSFAWQRAILVEHIAKIRFLEEREQVCKYAGILWEYTEDFQHKICLFDAISLKNANERSLICKYLQKFGAKISKFSNINRVFHAVSLIPLSNQEHVVDACLEYLKDTTDAEEISLLIHAIANIDLKQWQQIKRLTDLFINKDFCCKNLASLIRAISGIKDKKERAKICSFAFSCFKGKENPSFSVELILGIRSIPSDKRRCVVAKLRPFFQKAVATSGIEDIFLIWNTFHPYGLPVEIDEMLIFLNGKSLQIKDLYVHILAKAQVNERGEVVKCLNEIFDRNDPLTAKKYLKKINDTPDEFFITKLKSII